MNEDKEHYLKIWVCDKSDAGVSEMLSHVRL